MFPGRSAIKWRITFSYVILLVASLVCFLLFRDSLSALFIVSGITVLLIFLLSLYLSSNIAKPLRGLGLKCRDMARGKLEEESSSLCEINDLLQDFAYMTSSAKQRFEAFLNERRQWIGIVDQMEEGVIISSEEREVQFMNSAAAKILQVSRRESLGHPLVEVVRDYEIVEAVYRCLKTGEQQSKMVRAEGSSLSLRMTAMPLQVPQRPGALVVIQDITELNRVAKSRQEFVSNISHELRTPLASIKAAIETLEDGGIEDKMAAHLFLGKAGVEVDKMTQLIQQLGEIFRIESGSVAFKIELQNIVPLIEEVSQELQIQADRAGLEITVNISTGPLLVLADRNRIKEAIANLLHNSIKFTPPGGNIEISAWQEDSFVAISVADTGIGIPAEDIPHIFERFYKVDKSRSGEGMGLGLSITKHIVLAHGGDIRVESEEGKGATFTIILPGDREG